MVKKNILIVNKSLSLGGIQTSLMNMLGEICDKYDITLAVFNSKDLTNFIVPNNIKILQLSSLVTALGMSKSECLKYGTKAQIVFKYIGGIWSKLFGNTLPVKFAMLFQKNVGEYDVVISYRQETSSATMATGFGEFALKKCKASKKIAWIHSDFKETKQGTKKNLRTYKQFDKIIGVSKSCIDSFVEVFPELKNKCDYCYNCIPTEKIIHQSGLGKNLFERDEDTIVLFSACRLSKEKGILQAMKNILPLWKNNADIKWYIAGEGVEKDKIELFIEENNLIDKVILLGYKKNPYPYIKEADYLFLPSLHETYSMVAGEAHILGTPVIARDIPIMHEVLGENDVFCENGDFASYLKDLKVKNEKNDFPDVASEWKNRFERIIEC